jgi:hypothetical protein
MPGALALVLAVLGSVLRALQLMIAAPSPYRGEAARQLSQRLPLPGFDPRQRGPAFIGIAQKSGNPLLAP